MPQSPEVHDPTYLSHLFAFITGLVTVILSLVGFITHSFKRTQEDHQDQLDAGTQEFTNLKLIVQHLEDDNKSLRAWIEDVDKDNEKILEELAKIHDFCIKVTLHHEKQHGEKI